MSTKICFSIVTHNRREDFNALIHSLKQVEDLLHKYNVYVYVVDSQSDVPVPEDPFFELLRIDDQDSNCGLAGAWNNIVDNNCVDYEYFIFSNHDVLINRSIGQFFKALTELGDTDSYVLGPTSNPRGANPHQNGPLLTTTGVPTDIREKLPKERDLIHGFFWATNYASLCNARYAQYFHKRLWFDPSIPFAGTEDDWQFRLLDRCPETRFLVERSTYVFHQHYSDWRNRE